MTSAEEAEIGAMYVNAWEAAPQIIALVVMGYAQPRKSMQTDNSAAHSVVTTNIYPRGKKDMDVSFRRLSF